jgi:hypothetical protein
MAVQQKHTLRDERLKIVSMFDDAYDWDAMPVPVVKTWLATRDTSLLEPFLIPGRRPQYFHIREIKRSTMLRWVKAAAHDAELLMRCFMAGVEKIENLVQRAGTFVEEWTPPAMKNSEVMKEESLERLCGRDIEEIGEVCKQHSDFRMTTVDCFQPQLSLRLQWDALRSRRAAANPSSPASDSEKPSEDEEASEQSAQKTTDGDSSSADAA